MTNAIDELVALLKEADLQVTFNGSPVSADSLVAIAEQSAVRRFADVLAVNQPAIQNAEARARVKKKCTCVRDVYDFNGPGPEYESCAYCSNADGEDSYRARLVARLARWLRWRDEQKDRT